MVTESKTESGAALVEYISILAMIVIVSAFSIEAYSTQTSTNYSKLAYHMSGDADAVLLPDDGGGTEGTIKSPDEPELTPIEEGTKIPSSEPPIPAVAGMKFF